MLTGPVLVSFLTGRVDTRFGTIVQLELYAVGSGSARYQFAVVQRGAKLLKVISVYICCDPRVIHVALSSSRPHTQGTATALHWTFADRV